MGEKSPVYLATKKVMELFNFGNIYIFSYQNENDFKNLWDLLDLEENSLEKNFPPQSKVVIIWDNIPSSKSYNYINTSKYLTPIDWAVGFSLAVNNRLNDRTDTYPDVKILIFDT